MTLVIIHFLSGRMLQVREIENLEDQSHLQRNLTRLALGTDGLD